MKDIAKDDEMAVHASINTLKQTLISFFELEKACNGNETCE